MQFRGWQFATLFFMSYQSLMITIRIQRLEIIAFIFILLGRAESSETQLNITLDSYSEPVSIHTFTRDWNSKYQDGQHAFLHGRAELSQQNSRNELALLWRYDYLLDFTKDTAEIYNAYKKGLPPELQKTYLAKVNAKHIRALGIRWSPKFQVNKKLNILPGFNFLRGETFTDGSVQGSTRFIGSGFSKNDFGNTAINVNYHYDRPLLHEKDLDWDPKTPVGYGASLDLKLEYTPSIQSSLVLHLYDIFGKIYWQHAPKTQYEFDYKPKPQSYNLTGALAIDDRYTQELPMCATFTADFNKTNPWRAGFNLQTNQYVWLGQIYVGRQYINYLTKLIMEPQTHALGIGIEHAYLRLRWLADSLKTNEAHRLGFEISLRVPFGETQ